MNLLHQELTGSILKTFFNVVKQVGFGFDKQVYINAIAAELSQNQNDILTNKIQNIVHCNSVIGQLNFDIIVNDAVVVLADTNYNFIDRQQEELAKKYLRHSKYEVLLLLNFGLEASYKRLFLGNDYKQQQTNPTNNTEQTSTS
jgi:GxxExxY protein